MVVEQPIVAAVVEQPIVAAAVEQPIVAAVVAGDTIAELLLVARWLQELFVVAQVSELTYE